MQISALFLVISTIIINSLAISAADSSSSVIHFDDRYNLTPNIAEIELSNASREQYLFNQQNDSKRDIYCIPLPSNLTQCGLTTHVRLPNLLNHYSASELSSNVSMLEAISATKCSKNFDLFMCSILTPVCLDILILPCRSLCSSVKRSCEPVMHRRGYSWPIDCDRLPSARGSCISRKLPFELDGILKASDEYPSLTTTARPKSKRRKLKKNHANSTRSNNNSLSTTSIPTTTLIISTETTATTAPTETTPTTQNFIATTEIESASDINNLINSTDTAQSNNVSVKNSTQDLTQLLCMIQPEILIRTKLPDGALLTAASRKKLRLRAYRQIFGNFSKLMPTNNISANNSNQTSYFPILNLTMKNSTLFVSASKEGILIQTISEAIASLNATQQPQISTSKEKSASRNGYMIGFEPTNSTISVIIYLPSRPNIVESQVSFGAQNIIKAYRNFKSKRTIKTICPSSRNEPPRSSSTITTGTLKSRRARTEISKLDSKRSTKTLKS